VSNNVIQTLGRSRNGGFGDHESAFTLTSRMTNDMVEAGAT